MKTWTVEFTEQQRRNAVAFLKRVPLKGEEAPALVDLVRLLVTAKPSTTAEPETTEPRP